VSGSAALAVAGAAAANAAFALTLAPLLDGVERKVRARVQRRVGPPVLQTWYDLIKLYRRGFFGLRGCGPFHRAAPALAMGAAVTASAILPTVTGFGAGFAGDLIVLIYLMASVSTITALGAASSGSPYGVVGGWREASLSMASELALAAALAAIACGRGSLLLSSLFPAVRLGAGFRPSSVVAVAAVALVAYADGLRLPFEIPEAEEELAEGVAVEYGGAALALLKHATLVRRLLLTSLLLNLAFPWGWASPVVRAAAFTASLTLESVLCSLTESVCGRGRPAYVMRLLKRVTLASGVALIAACFGF